VKHHLIRIATAASSLAALVMVTGAGRRWV